MIKREKVKNLSIINKQTIECFNEYNTIEYFDTGSVHEGVFDVPAILNLESDRIPSRAKRVVKDNTIIISSVRPNLKHYAIFKNPKPNTIVSTGFVTIDANQNMNPLYLYYILTNDDTTKFLSNIANTSVSSYPSFKPNDIGEYEIEYDDDLNMQNKIVDIIKPIDDRINLNDNIINKLESMMKDIYDYWFVQFDFPNEKGKPYKSSGGKMVYNEKLKREIPAIFEIKTVEDFCDIFTGKKDVNKSLDNGKYKFFSCAPEFRYSNEYLYDGKAILVSGNGSYTGRTIFVNDKFDLYQRTYAIVNKDDIQDIIEYIYLSLKTYFVLKVKGGTHGSAIPYIVYNDIANEPILYNKEIIMKFIDIVKQLLQKIIAIKNQNDKLKEYKNFILPLLMNGQVEVK